MILLLCGFLPVCPCLEFSFLLSQITSFRSRSRPKESETCYNLVERLRGNGCLPLEHEQHLKRQWLLFLHSIGPLAFITEGKIELSKYHLLDTWVFISRGHSSRRISFVNHGKKSSSDTKLWTLIQENMHSYWAYLLALSSSHGFSTVPCQRHPLILSLHFLGFMLSS